MSSAVNDAWVVAEPPKGLAEFLAALFEKLDEPFRHFHSAIAFLAQAICGTEIEGGEVTLGIVLYPSAPRHARSTARFSSSLLERWRSAGIDLFFKPDRQPAPTAEDNLAKLRKITETLRQFALGWAPGMPQHPVLHFVYDADENLMKLDCVALQRFRGTGADESYERESRDGVLALWLKPSATMRLYYDGRWLAQIVRLRDTNSWALRSIEHLRQFLTTEPFVDASRIPVVLKVHLDKILRVALLLSEERSGGTIYFVEEGFFQNNCVVEDATRQAPSKQAYFSRYAHNCEGTLADVEWQELATYVRQDGAAVVDHLGKLEAVGVYTRAPGGRKDSARHMVRKHKHGHAILVSQDGGLYFFSNTLRSSFRTPPAGKDAKEFPEARLDFLPVTSPAFRGGGGSSIGKPSLLASAPAIRRQAR